MSGLRWTPDQVADHVCKRIAAPAVAPKVASNKAKPAFIAMCVAAGLPAPVAEYRFHPVRRWRFDYAWPEPKIAVEVEGGVFVQGRHSRGAGMRADMDKYNAAALAGWKVLRYLPEQLRRAAVDVQLLIDV